MEKIMFIFLFLFSINVHAYKGTAAVGSIITNPSAGQSMVTTGSLSSGCASGNGGNYIVEVYASSSVAATFDLQTLSGGNPVSHIYLMVPASTTTHFDSKIDFVIPDGLTISLINLNSGLLGTMQANIFWAVESCN